MITTSVLSSRLGLHGARLALGLRTECCCCRGALLLLPGRRRKSSSKTIPHNKVSGRYTLSAPFTISAMVNTAVGLSTARIVRFLADRHGITPVTTNPLVYVASTMSQAEWLTLFFYADRLVGLDRETAVNPRRAREDPSTLPSVIQIANSNVCVLYQTYRIFRSSGNIFPSSLRTLLSDAAVIKGGVGLDLDLYYITKYPSVTMRGMLRFEELAMPFGFRAHNLADLAADAINLKLNKSGRLQRSCDWDFDLTDRAIQYASQDAFASFRIAQALLNPRYFNTWDRVNATNQEAVKLLINDGLVRPFRELYNTVVHSRIMQNVPVLYQPQYALLLLREALIEAKHPLPKFLQSDEGIFDIIRANLSVVVGENAYTTEFSLTPQSLLNEHETLKHILTFVGQNLINNRSFTHHEFHEAVYASPTFRHWSTLCKNEVIRHWTTQFLSELHNQDIVRPVSNSANNEEEHGNIDDPESSTLLTMTDTLLPSHFHMPLPTPDMVITALPTPRTATSISLEILNNVFVHLHKQFPPPLAVRRRAIMGNLFNHNMPELKGVPMADRETRTRVARRYLVELESRGMLMKIGEPSLYHLERPSDPQVLDRQLLSVVNPVVYFNSKMTLSVDNPAVIVDTSITYMSTIELNDQ